MFVLMQWAAMLQEARSKQSPAKSYCFRQALQLLCTGQSIRLKKGGIISIVGVYGPTDNLIPIGNVVNKGITIRANQTPVKRLLPKLISHIQEGNIDPKGIITHRVPLEEVSEAYHIFSAKLDNCIKTILIPSTAN